MQMETFGAEKPKEARQRSGKVTQANRTMALWYWNGGAEQI
jgi:hypothetical protein